MSDPIGGDAGQFADESPETPRSDEVISGEEDVVLDQPDTLASPGENDGGETDIPPSPDRI